MKKILSALLTAIMLLTGCNGPAENDTLQTDKTSLAVEETEAAEVNDAENTMTKDDVFGEQKITLRFRDDGTFRVLVFSDIHGSGSSLPDDIKDRIRLLVDREDPDLVIFDGDNTWQETNKNSLEKCVTEITEYIEELGIPWCHVYGNHDGEGSNVPKAEQQEIYESFAHCISQSGPDDITGIGNYVLPVYAHDSDEVKYTVWALDSGDYISTTLRNQYMPVESPYKGYEFSSYAYLATNQILWYYSTSEEIEKEYGNTIPGIMAFHIPVQECYYAWQNRDGISYSGAVNESICAGGINSGIFAAVLERGDIKGMVFGHDHTNDFTLDYCGVKLCGASTVSPLAYWSEEVAGARVFVLGEDGSLDTYMSYLTERVELNASDYSSLNNSVILDFDGYTPEFSVSSFDDNISSSAYVDEIEVEFGTDRGLDGTSALSVTRSNYRDDFVADNFEVKMTIENPGTVGDSKYLVVWMDLTGDDTAIDFRKADFGLIANYAEGSAYCTDNYDTPSEFWYLAEGTDSWIKMKHGNDGCFGAAQNSSVEGYKGWFAFPLEYMRRFGDGASLKSDTVITGVYFYGCLAEKNMAGQHVYIDHIMLTDDYTTVTAAN